MARREITGDDTLALAAVIVPTVADVTPALVASGG